LSQISLAYNNRAELSRGESSTTRTTHDARHRNARKTTGTERKSSNHLDLPCRGSLHSSPASRPQRRAYRRELQPRNRTSADSSTRQSSSCPFHCRSTRQTGGEVGFQRLLGQVDGCSVWPGEECQWNVRRTARCVRTRKIKFSTFGGKGEEEGTRSEQKCGLEWLP